MKQNIEQNNDLFQITQDACNLKIIVKPLYVESSKIAALIHFVCEVIKDNPNIKTKIGSTAHNLGIGQMDLIQREINKIILLNND